MRISIGSIAGHGGVVVEVAILLHEACQSAGIEKGVAFPINSVVPAVEWL